MKTKTFVVVAFLFVFWSLISWRSEIDKTSATVEVKDGVSIFIESAPVSKFSVLGTVRKSGVIRPVDLITIRFDLLQKVKKDYPEADGMIVKQKDLGSSTVATAIKFE